MVTLSFKFFAFNKSSDIVLVSSLNHLPDLIVWRILEHVFVVHFNFKLNIPYLAICRNWRRVALPLVYKTLYIRSVDNGSEDGPEWQTNIDLFQSIDYCSLAQHLFIHDNWMFRKDLSINILMAFLNIINQEPVQWPSDYQQKLVSLDIPLDTYMSSPLMLSKELLGIVESVVWRFVQRFPGIQHMQLYNSQTNGIFRQLNSVLANFFGNGLRSLDAWELYGVDLANFSENLTCLSYACNMYSFPLLPKINTLPLKKLHLLSIPEDFSWNLFQGDPVVFPNLVDLSMDFNGGNITRRQYAERCGFDVVVPNSLASVKFHRLRKLAYNNNHDKFIFNPELIPSHLESACLYMSWNAFCIFSKLPIDSIDTLDVKISTKPDNVSACYRAGDRVFNDIKNVGETSLSFIHNSLPNMEQVHWKNVNTISLENSNIRELIYITSNMPQITRISSLTFCCREPEDDLKTYLYSNESRLEKLSIWRSSEDGFIEYPIEFFVRMLGSFKHLQEVRVGQDVFKEVKEQVHGLCEEYPKLKEMKII